MTILYGTYDLLKEPPRFGLFHPSLVDDVFEQLLPGVFDDHDDIRRRRDDLVQFDDMGVSEDFEVLDLSFDSGGHVHVLDLATVDDLHGDLVAGHRVGGH